MNNAVLIDTTITMVNFTKTYIEKEFKCIPKNEFLYFFGGETDDTGPHTPADPPEGPNQ